MKSVKWMYVSAMAIAFGMLSFATVACHDDDDDPKPAEGEVIETPKPVVEYYIKGAVTVKGEGKSGIYRAASRRIRRDIIVEVLKDENV